MHVEQKNEVILNMNIHIFSTKMDDRCGIGAYTKYLKDELKKLGLRITYTFLETESQNPFYYLKIATKVSKNCDIVHIQFEYPFFGKLGPMTGIYTPLFYTCLHLLSCTLSFKIVTTMHEIWETKNPPKFRELGAIYITFINKFIFRFSDLLIVLSWDAKNKLVRQGVPKGKIYLTPHGLNVPRFMDKNECKKKIGLNPNKKIITIFGFIKRSKGHDLLIKASKHLNKNTIILIAGDMRSKKSMGYLEELKSIATDRTIFYGFVEEENIPIILNATDIMVLPYREVTQSGILNWSLAYEIPTITSNLPYFREINKKYSCILLFENENIRSLIYAVNKLLNDKELQNILRSSCKKYRSENTFERAAKETYRAYLASLKKV